MMVIYLFIYLFIYTNCYIITDGHGVARGELGVVVEGVHELGHLALLLALLLQVDRVGRDLGGPDARGLVQDHRVPEVDRLQVALKNDVLVDDEPLRVVPDVLGLDERRVQVRYPSALCAYEVPLGLSQVPCVWLENFHPSFPSFHSSFLFSFCFS